LKLLKRKSSQKAGLRARTFVCPVYLIRIFCQQLLIDNKFYPE